jgi:hypothetical protein
MQVRSDGAAVSNRESRVTDALNSATFHASIFGDHAGSVASQVIALAVAHPVLTFQVFALLSILMHRRGSQI